MRRTAPRVLRWGAPVLAAVLAAGAGLAEAAPARAGGHAPAASAAPAGAAAATPARSATPRRSPSTTSVQRRERTWVADLVRTLVGGAVLVLILGVAGLYLTRERRTR
jgi:hypothetical protein